MKKIINRMKVAIGFIMFLWIMHFVGILFLPIIDFRQYGIVPRTMHGLIGIFFSPFIHRNISYLISNTIGLILPMVMLFSYEKKAFRIILLIILLGGFGTWLIGGDASHIGASGLIYGLVGYLIFWGIFQRNIWSVLVSIFALYLFIGIIPTLFVAPPSVSWSGHVCGFIAGIIIAKLTTKKLIK